MVCHESILSKLGNFVVNGMTPYGDAITYQLKMVTKTSFASKLYFFNLNVSQLFQLPPFKDLFAATGLDLKWNNFVWKWKWKNVFLLSCCAVVVVCEEFFWKAQWKKKKEKGGLGKNNLMKFFLQFGVKSMQSNNNFTRHLELSK